VYSGEVLAASIVSVMVAAASTSETSVSFYQTALRNIAEDSHLQLGEKVQMNRKISCTFALDSCRVPDTEEVNSVKSAGC
jgi:hypothetical protein